MKNLLLYAIIFVFFLPIETSAQRKKERNKKGEETANTVKKSKAIQYADFVNEDTKTDEGLFKVHENKEKFVYEIPKSYLGKEMLLVTRIKELPAGLGGGYVNAGSKINTQVIVWEQYKNKVLLKVKSYNADSK